MLAVTGNKIYILKSPSVLGGHRRVDFWGVIMLLSLPPASLVSLCKLRSCPYKGHQQRGSKVKLIELCVECLDHTADAHHRGQIYSSLRGTASLTRAWTLAVARSCKMD